MCVAPLFLDEKALLSKIGGLDNKLLLQGSFGSLHDLINHIILFFFGFLLLCSFALSFLTGSALTRTSRFCP